MLEADIEKAARDFRERGFCVLPRALSQTEILEVRSECDAVVSAITGQAAGRGRADAASTVGCIFEPLRCVRAHQGATGVRDTDEYKALRAPPLNPRVSEALFGRRIRALVSSLLDPADGHPCFLLNEQYIVKPPYAGQRTEFPWHRDSAWCDDGEAAQPLYVSVWIPLDDVSEENGTLYVLPYPPDDGPIAAAGGAGGAGGGRGGWHERRARGYPPAASLGSGFDAGGLPMTLSAGDAVALSSYVLHCSGPNLGDEPRRVWMPQFSREPLVGADGALVAHAVPLAAPAAVAAGGS